MKRKLLLIGAGPTASLIAYNISKSERLSKIVDIEIWEKMDKIGGRFATTKIDNKFEIDFGAQYLTNSGKWSSSYFDNLVHNDLIRPLDTSQIAGFVDGRNKKHFICTKGTGSIVEHFFQQGGVKTDLDIKLLTNVIEIKCEREKVMVESKDVERNGKFDIVVSTIPTPLLIQLQNFNKLVKNDNDLKLNLALVNYTSRFALGLFYDKIPTDIQHFKKPILSFASPSDSSDIRFWRINESLNSDNKHVSIIAHSSTQFGAKYINDEQTAQKILLPNILERVEKCIGSSKPCVVQLQKWDFSQVKMGYPYEPGFVEINHEPLIIAAGDSFTCSGFEGCILSAEKTTERIRLLLT